MSDDIKIRGYNCPRPTKSHFDSFYERFTIGLRRLNIEGLSLMVYGSYLRADFVPGSSDIDAILTFPDDVVIDRERVRKVSEVIADAQQGNDIPLQLSVVDITTMRNGMFNPYDPSWEDYFKERAIIVIGPDYRKYFTYLMPKHPVQSRVQFNLRKSRQRLVLAEYHRRTNYPSFLEGFNRTLSTTSRGVKLVLAMIDNDVRESRFTSLDTLTEIFPEVDAEKLRRIKQLHFNPGELDLIYPDAEKVRKEWESAVTLLEEVVRAYIKKFPRLNQIKMRSPKRNKLETVVFHTFNDDLAGNSTFFRVVDDRGRETNYLVENNAALKKGDKVEVFRGKRINKRRRGIKPLYVALRLVVHEAETGDAVTYSSSEELLVPRYLI